MQTCRAGRVFYTPGETGEALFILKKGRVQLYRMSPEGRKLVIARLEPICFFGEMSCVGQGMYNTFAEATEDSLICTMSRHDVERLLLSKPQVAVRILEATRAFPIPYQIMSSAADAVAATMIANIGDILPAVASPQAKINNGMEVIGTPIRLCRVPTFQ